MRLYFYLLPFFLISCVQSEKNEIPHKELAITFEKFNNAFAEGNLAILDSLTTENYLHTNSNSKVITKDEWFNYLRKRNKQLESGAIRILDYEFTEQKIEFHGTTSIITGKVKVVSKDSLGTKESQYRVTNIWVFKDGGWKRAGFHDGKIK